MAVDQLHQRAREAIHTIDEDHWFIVRPNIFAIPYLDGYILFSPLQGLAALITRAGLSSLLLNESASISESLSNCLFDDDFKTLKLFDTQPIYQPSMKPRKISEFKPYSLMISPTSACQLNCAYCYIRGGEKPRNMQWHIAEAAISYTFENALLKRLPTYSINLHGQGEPTANWKVFSDTVLFAEELCANHKIRPIFHVTTNGILSEDKIDFIANHNLNVILSMDGLKETMDSQRPLRGGGSSFDKVMRTIRNLEEKRKRFTIRSTITDLNMPEMDDFVDFIRNETECRHVCFEPVFNSGRAQDHKFGDRSITSQFAKKFLETQREAKTKGVRISFSACRIEGVRTAYCGAYGPKLTFAVSTDGLISSCYAVLEESDPRSDIFIYGRYDKSSNSFRFDTKRLERLLSLNIDKITRCSNCFLKWNCGGGCLSKLAYKGFENMKTGEQMHHCKTDYDIIKQELFRSIIKNYNTPT